MPDNPERTCDKCAPRFTRMYEDYEIVILCADKHALFDEVVEALAFLLTAPHPVRMEGSGDCICEQHQRAKALLERIKKT